MTSIDPRHLESTVKLIRLALDEDIGRGDATALAVPASQRAKARMVAKQSMVLSGLEIARLVLEEFKADAKVIFSKRDGEFVEKGDLVLEFEGNARHLLTTERTILNIIQRLSGVATAAKAYKDCLAGAPLLILDTRKTTPGLRYWEKKAVKDGGLHNHRFGLDDAILIKENHIRAAGSIENALKNIGPTKLSIEVEVTNWIEAKEAIDHGATKLLLDNFEPSSLGEIVKKLRAYKNPIFLEASGGITIGNLPAFAASGVDAVSIGALTHSVMAADLSLLFEFL